MQSFLVELIDLAVKTTGSDTKLAEALLVSKTVVSDWRHGRKRAGAADVALMAHIAGLDADAWAARAVIDSYEGNPKGELLKQALKKAFLATGAAIVSSGANAAPVINAAHDVLHTMYMMFTKFRTCTFSNGTLSTRDDHQGGRGAPPIPPSSVLTLFARTTS